MYLKKYPGDRNLTEEALYSILNNKGEDLKSIIRII